MLVGAAVVGWWGSMEGGIFELYEILPGFVANVLVAVGVSLATFKSDPRITQEFDESKRVSELLVAETP